MIIADRTRGSPWSEESPRSLCDTGWLEKTNLIHQLLTQGNVSGTQRKRQLATVAEQKGQRHRERPVGAGSQGAKKLL